VSFLTKGSCCPRLSGLGSPSDLHKEWGFLKQCDPRLKKPRLKKTFIPYDTPIIVLLSNPISPIAPPGIDVISKPDRPRNKR
jgi:hypothetical protein